MTLLHDDQRDALPEGLRPLQLADLKTFKDALIAGKQQGWAYYFPFLILVHHGRRSSRLLWAEDDGSVCLFVLKTNPGKRLNLYFPPFPLNDGALRRSLELANDFNRRHAAWIYWVDEQDLEHIERLQSLQMVRRNPQYLYDPNELVSLHGSRYRTLRRNLGLARRIGDIDVRPYTLSDASECQKLLQLWELKQNRKDPGIIHQHRYAMNCFQMAPRFSERDLRGLVFRIGGHIRAFAFGGELRPQLGCSLLTIADPDVVCLSYLVRQRFLTGQSDWLVVNDGSDAGHDGLRQMKTRFRPARLHLTYKGKQIRRLPLPRGRLEKSRISQRTKQCPLTEDNIDGFVKSRFSDDAVKSPRSRRRESHVLRRT